MANSKKKKKNEVVVRKSLPISRQKIITSLTRVKLCDAKTFFLSYVIPDNENKKAA